MPQGNSSSIIPAVIGVILAMFVFEEKRLRTPINAVVLSEAVKDDNLLRLSGLGIITQVITFLTVFGFLPVAGKELGASHMEFPLLMGLCIKNFAAHKRTTAMGVFQAAYGLGMFGGPVLAGLISGAFGLHVGFAVTGIIGLVGAVLAGWPRYLPLGSGWKRPVRIE